MNYREKAKAFTLIELLVVVAIIALLISILLPALKGARAQGKQTKCLANLNAMSKAVHYYAEENREWRVGGILSHRPRGTLVGTEYGGFMTAMLKGLGYDNDQGPVLGLWNNQATTLDANGARLESKLVRAIRSVGVMQCPDFPIENAPLGYVANAMPMPMPEDSFTEDSGANGQFRDDASYQGVDMSGIRRLYVQARKLTEIPRELGEARAVHITEAHISLAAERPNPTEAIRYEWDRGEGLRFYHFFFPSQLPLGFYPRIANDRRHPSGITTLHYDGHSELIRPQKFDAGWGNPWGIRLRNVTIPPEARW